MPTHKRAQSPDGEGRAPGPSRAGDPSPGPARLLDRSVDACLAVTAAGDVCYANRSACRLLGCQPDELLGRRLSDIDCDHDQTRWHQLYASTKASGSVSLRSRWRRNTGAPFPVEVTATHLHEAGRDVVYLLARDATELERLREELHKSHETTPVAGPTSTAFLASLSHEIRTPMNTVLGLAELLWETPLSPDQRKYVRMLRRAGSTLLTLLNDIQDLSRVEAGRFRLESEDFLLDELLDKTMEIMTMRANEKGLDLAGYIAPDVPCELVGDPNRLQQILVNLISNAIKFTERGEVVVRVEREPGVDDPGALHFLVADTGIGIPESERDTIFESFAQIAGASRSEGSGLGLAIAKQLVELMGGRIWLESTVGRGSTFSFTVTLELQARAPVQAPAPPVALAGCRVLIADANPTHRLIMKDPLVRWGARVSEVAAAQDLLTELRRASAEAEPYQLVLLDRRLPDLDTFKVAESIQSDPALHNLAVIILTSETWADDIARTYELGVAGYLVKPIRRHDLVQAVTIALNRARSGEPTGAAAERGSLEQPHPIRVLVVEDSPDNRFLITSFLDHPAYEVDTAEHGEAGVDKFRQGVYDLVLMDLQMPVMDGYAAIRAMRAWEREQGRDRATPIIALTATPLTDKEARAEPEGWSAHLTKPITKKTLLRVVEQHTGQVSR